MEVIFNFLSNARMHRWIVLCAVAATFAANGQNAAVAPLDSYTRDASLVDAYVPVITMEQLGDSQNNLQGYRIQIFKDGRAIYQGWREVRTLGEVNFHIAPEQVQTIQAEFARYKFWEVPEDQYGLPRGLGSQGWLFTLRDERSTKTVRASGSGYIAVLRKIIEDAAKTDRWRCPYVDIRGDEKCALLETRGGDSINWFITRDLPKFLETYK